MAFNDWRIGPTDYCFPPGPVHARATDIGPLVIGQGIEGFVDEVAVHTNELSPQYILDNWITLAGGGSVTALFGFDNVDITVPQTIPDVTEPASKNDELILITEPDV